MTWEWESVGMAGADFASVDEAVAALTQSMERAASRYSNARQREVVKSCIDPMVARMRTEGARALAEGRVWSEECQGLYVTMHPKGRDSLPTP